VSQCQRGKLFLPGGEKRIGGDDEPARSQLDQVCKHSIEVTFGAGVQDVELQPKSTSRPLQAAQTELGSNGINRVKEESHDARCGYQFAQQLQCLRPYLYAQIGHARDVAARAVKAGNETEPDRVVGRLEDDRNGGARRLCRKGRRDSCRGNHGHLALNQLGRHCR
jgi:hypothetical protein